MPLFSYVCQRCSAESEILVRGSERPECPECGSLRLTKQLSAFAPVSGSPDPGIPPSPCGSCDQARGGICPYS
jgi:putative FmdB family regulatory protein